MRLDIGAPRGDAAGPAIKGGPSDIAVGPKQRVVRAGEYIYREGDQRDFVYRVDKGAVAVFEKHVGRPNSTVELAAEGDFVGLGSFEEHYDNARAIVNSTISCLERHEFMERAECDPVLRKKQSDAAEREFEHLKARAVGPRRSTLVECVAAFLVSVSRQNAHEGRDPAVITDSLKCGVVANLLGVDIDSLALALVELQNRGLIAIGDHGCVQLTAMDGLERLADGLDLPVVQACEARNVA